MEQIIKQSFFTSERVKGFALALAVFATTFLFRYFFMFVVHGINNWVVEMAIWGINSALFVAIILGLGYKEYKHKIQGAVIAWVLVLFVTFLFIYLSHI